MDGPWRIELLGGLRATQRDRNITRFRTRKTGALLAYLAYHRDRAHPREELIDLLWPECDLEAGRNCLRVALSSLRRQLEPPGVPAGAVLLTDRGNVRVNPEACTTDVAAFGAALQNAARAADVAERIRRLADAVAIYRGPLLPGYYEDWILPERQRLAEAVHQAVARWIALLEREGDLSDAVQVARRAVSVDPLREEMRRELMRLLAATGKPEAALTEYDELAQRLAAELDAEPSPETQALARSLCETRERGSVPAETASVAAASPVPRSSPHSFTPLPTGTVTFLLTTIDGGPAERNRQASPSPLAPTRTRDLLRLLFSGHGGREIRVAGSSEARLHQAGASPQAFAFGRASEALSAAVAGQQAVGSAELRMALCLGEVTPGEEISRSPAVLQAMRLLAVALSGQILVSEATAAVLREQRAPGLCLVDGGLYRLCEGVPPERVFQVRFPELPPSEPDAAVAATSWAGLRPVGDREAVANFPLRLTRFFGREDEIARLVGLLKSFLGSNLAGVPRLVTLTGPGGCGKTRLALEVAAQLLGTDGNDRARNVSPVGPVAVPDPFGAVWFVPLADLAEAGLIFDRALDALRLPRGAGREPLERVAVALSHQPTLLVLDNFEHLLEEGAPLIRTLLERVPTLVCLITSRRRLDLPVEMEFAVPPLPAPEAGARCHGPRALLQYASVQLFVDRAQAIRPDFQVTPANAAAVAALCERLEGIPLALELAAARAWALTPAQMLAHLERRFDFLVGRRQAADARHQTMRAAIDWSYQLLPTELQRFLTRLSLFRGGWTLEAAAAVCREDGEAPPAENPAERGTKVPETSRHLALEDLEQLRKHSLVLAEEQGPEMRFRMPETLREYAGERLPPAERATLARRHADYFVALAEQAGLAFHGPNLAERCERLERERDNLRAVLDWSLAGGDLGLGLRLGAALSAFWTFRGYLTEGWERLSRLLSFAAPESASEPGRRCPEPAVRARALYATAIMASTQGEYDAARALTEESIPLWQALGNERYLAAAQSHLGNIAVFQGEYALAESLLTEGLALRRRLGIPYDIALSVTSLGEMALDRDDIGTAQALFQESLAMVREQNDPHLVAFLLDCLGEVARGRGEYETARARHEEALALFREWGDRKCMSRALWSLGKVAGCRGEYELATSLHRESLVIRGELGAKREIAECLEGVAEGLAGGGGACETAARLFGAAAALRVAIRAPAPASLKPERELRLASLRQVLGERAFTAAWAEGAAMTWQRATAEALGDTGRERL